MKKSYRVISIFLILGIIISLFSGLSITPVSAAGSVKLGLDGARDTSNEYLITDNSVTLKWNPVLGASTYVISRDDLAPAGDITVTASTYTISDLLPNRIYHFAVEAKDSGGNTIATFDNELNVLTGDMDFSCINISEESSSGNESGLNPGLKLQWTIPEIWDGSDFTAIDSEKIDYLVSAGTDKAASNMGNYEVYYDGGITPYGYDVIKQGETTVSKLVYDADITNGVFSYEWWRYRNFSAGTLNDDSLKAGTVYYIKVYPQFNTSAKNPNNTGIGKTISKSSALADGYVCTSLHVKIEKDASDNTTCVIDRINYDSEDGTKLINFKYEVYSSPDSGMMSPNLEGYEYEQFGDLSKPIEIFLPHKSDSSIYYYKIYAKSDNYDNINSSIIQYDMSLDEGKPPIPQNVVIEGTHFIKSGNQEGAKADIKWDKPSGVDSGDIRYHVLVSLLKTDAKDEDGVYYKEVIDGIPYDIRYRTVKILNESDLDFSENGYIKYALNGLDLLQDHDAFGDGYPAQLRLNKIYYLKIYSEKISSGLKSDYSLPAGFTTPGETRRLPVPELFSLETVDTDRIGLVWQKTTVSLTDYNLPADSDYSVTYDIYIGDSLSKDNTGSYTSFIHLGSYADTPSAGLNYNARRAQISSFVGNAQAAAKFGSNVKPDTTYYFMIRSRMDVVGEAEPLYSDFSYIVPVTTKRGDIVEPGNDTIKPKAPVGFDIDLDSEGNPRIKSNQATLKWMKLQDNVSYRFIRTSKVIDVNADITQLQSDASLNFLQYTLPDNLAPDSTNKYVYTVQSLQPNTVYYFSLRSEKTLSNGSTVVSEWITVPVTTIMLEPPDMLDFVKDGTYNAYTQLKIKWRAKETYDSQIWIMSESQTDYSRSTNVTVTYDKPADIQGTDMRMNYAVISGLTSNKRYYIKVRNSFTAVGNTIPDLSKFVGPIISRTEFDQSDYDDDQNKKEEEDLFNDRIKDLRNALYWIIENDNDSSKIKLRAERIINSMKYDSSKAMVIDMGFFKRASDEDEEDKTISDDKEIIIPYEVIQYINANKETLVIRTSFGEVHIRPGAIDDSITQISAMKNPEDEDDIPEEIYLDLKFENAGQSDSDISSSMKGLLASEVTDFTVQVMGMDKTEEDIEKSIDSKLISIISKKLSSFLNKSKKDKDTDDEIYALIDKYRAEIIEDIGEYAGEEVEDATDIGPEEVTSLSGPIGFRYKYSISRDVNYYSGYLHLNKQWNKIPSIVDYSNNSADFEVKKVGKLAVFKAASSIKSSNGNAQTNEQLTKLDLKYGITSILAINGTFNGQLPITVKQLLLVVQKILGDESPEDEAVSKMLVQLSANSSFKLLSGSHNITREEAAYIAMRLYAQKSGISETVYKPKRSIAMADYKDINPSYYKAVSMAADLKVMNTDNNKKILPKGQINMENTLLVLARTLMLLGEI